MIKIMSGPSTNARNLNFVDDNNVVVGWEDRNYCCEDHRWWWATTPDTISDDEQCHLNESDLQDYYFDVQYFKEYDDNYGYEYTGRVEFRITNGTNSYYLVFYNSHNGYYSHGFNMTVDGKDKQSGYI